MTPAPYNQSVAIVDDNTDRTSALAQCTDLKLIEAAPQWSGGTAKPDNSRFTNYRFTLAWIENKLTLQDHSKKSVVSVCIDFTQGRALHRLKFGGGHGQELARAIKTREHPLVCDATAGLGRDAFVIASLGCEVVLLEQSAIVHALLQDAITRATIHTETAAIAERMALYHSNSTLLPDNWPHHLLPDVVYLDPMYPDGKRTAKKEIQALRSLLEPARAATDTVQSNGVESDTKDYETALLQAARSTAKRVVVKRPRKAPPLADTAPSGNITSPNTRYDIYSSKTSCYLPSL